MITFIHVLSRKVNATGEKFGAEERILKMCPTLIYGIDSLEFSSLDLSPI